MATSELLPSLCEDHGFQASEGGGRHTVVVVLSYLFLTPHTHRWPLSPIMDKPGGRSVAVARAAELGHRRPA